MEHQLHWKNEMHNMMMVVVVVMAIIRDLLEIQPVSSGNAAPSCTADQELTAGKGDVPCIQKYDATEPCQTACKTLR